MVASYQNPIRRGMYPDPSISRVGSTYFMVNSTFEYFPGISVSRSTDLLNWEALPGVVRHTSQADLSQAKSNEGIFAACIRFYEGRFYVVTTNFAEWKTFLISGEYREASGDIVWSDHRAEIGIDGIDPDLYCEGGHAYVQYTGYAEGKKKAISQVEIDLRTGALLGEPKILTYGTGGRDVEGPHIIKRNGWYYLLTAEGGTGQGHMITIFRSSDLWGPYTPAPGNPILSNRDNAEEPLQNIGHGDLFTDEAGNWWLTCLGTRPIRNDFKEFTTIGRETLLYPVSWTGEWPEINNGQASQTVNLAQFPDHAAALRHEQRIHGFKDDFTNGTIKPDWLSLREGLGDRLHISAGTLTLQGSPSGLDDLATPSFLGLRQSEPNELLTVAISPETTALNQGQAGVALTINSTHYASLLISRSGTAYELTGFIQDEDLKVSRPLGTVSELPKTLSILSENDHKTFTATFDNEPDVSFTTSAVHFSNEAICALNTGNISGIYALGNAELGVGQVTRKALPERPQTA